MPVQDDTGVDVPCDKAFVALHAAYRGTGGMLRGGDTVRLLQARRGGDFTSLARLILSGDIFSLAWLDTFWVPMFQFEPGDLSVKQGARQVLAELAGDFDGWQLAIWFVRPNGWLEERRPVDSLEADLPSVLNAARADRFVAAG